MHHYLSELCLEMNFATTILLLLLTYIVISFFSLHTKTKKQNYNLRPSPFSIMLNVFELGRKPQYQLAKLANIHGPIMHLKLDQMSIIVISSIMHLKLGQMLVISSPDTAKEVLQTYDHLFSNKTIPQYISVLDHEHFSLPFMPVCDLWRDFRRICKNELFSSKTLDASHQLRIKKLRELLADIDRSSLIGESVDVGQATFKTSMNFLSNTFFSMDFVNSTGDTEEYKGIIENLVRSIGTPNLVDFFPVLGKIDPEGLRGVGVANIEKILQIMDTYIIKRMELREGENYVTNNNMLDNLLDICQENGEKMDNTKIKHLFLDLFIAGTDTTSYTIERAMVELVHNTHAMSKLKEELEQIIGKGNTIEESYITRLPYLQAVVKETLRLHPSAPLLLPRKVKMDVTLQGYTIPGGSQVLVNQWAMGRNPKIWDNPTLFSPERFLDSEITFKGQYFEFTPFGSGRRICPGMPLAIRMLHTMLGSLVNFFDWKLESGDRDIDQPLRAIPVRVNKA